MPAAELTFNVDVVERDDGHYWFSTDAAGTLQVWNAAPFPTRDAAGRDAYATHARWVKDRNRMPYGDIL